MPGIPPAGPAGGGNKVNICKDKCGQIRMLVYKYEDDCSVLPVVAEILGHSHRGEVLAVSYFKNEHLSKAECRSMDRF